MKKVFLLIAMLLLACPAGAANWVEIGYKNYIDASSINRETKYYDRGGAYNPHYQVSAWVKSLNPGDWEKFENKKIWYEQNFVSANCLSKQINIQSKHIYDLNGNVVYSKQYMSEWLDVVPDSVGESWFVALCASPEYFTSKYINKEDWRSVNSFISVNYNSISYSEKENLLGVTAIVYRVLGLDKWFNSISKKAKKAKIKIIMDFKTKKYTITEITAYNKKGKIIFQKDFSNPTYFDIDEDCLVFDIIKFILENP